MWVWMLFCLYMWHCDRSVKCPGCTAALTRWCPPRQPYKGTSNRWRRIGELLNNHVLPAGVQCALYKTKKKKTWRFTPLANQCNVTFKSLTTVWNATRPAPHHQVLCFWAAEPYHVLSLRVFGSYAACMRHRCSFNTPNRVFTGLELHPQRQRVFSVYHHDLLRSRSLIKSFHLTERLNKWYSTNYGLISHSSNIDVSPN